MKVYLIGAGPGDPGLLTVRGKEILSFADVVVYDYLAAPALLDWARRDAECIYVGKEAGAHTLSQDGINRLLVDKAREGKVVARLKGGDPYIFGRGGEEALFLREAGIPFEEVPGISSTIAGPAYAGIPLTHRNYASSVTLITGHEDADKAASSHDWPALARSASTLVFVMGMKHLPEISHKLIEAGRSPNTPAAVIHWATTPQHRSLTASLAELPDRARESGFTNPSLIVVGEVVALHDSLNWFEQRPLLGKGIVVTRSRDQASDIAGSLEALGARVIQFPAIRIQPVQDCTDIDAAISCLADYGWLVFTSANGVACFWDRLCAGGLDSRALARCKVAAIGPATAEALAERGIIADCLPAEYRAEGVVAELLAAGVRGERILLPRARVARDVLPESLRKAGAEVDVVPVYDTVADTGDCTKLHQFFEENHIQCITFGSSSTVDNFFAVVDAAIVRKAAPCFACIGPITAATLEKYGFACDIQPQEYTIPALVAAIEHDFSGSSRGPA